MADTHAGLKRNTLAPRCGVNWARLSGTLDLGPTRCPFAGFV